MDYRHPAPAGATRRTARNKTFFGNSAATRHGRGTTEKARIICFFILKSIIGSDFAVLP
jgi:hypothetical protein